MKINILVDLLLLTPMPYVYQSPALNIFGLGQHATRGILKWIGGVLNRNSDSYVIKSFTHPSLTLIVLRLKISFFVTYGL